MLQHDVLAVAFFPALMPEKSSGLFGSLEGDLCIPIAGKVFWSPKWNLLHFPMPGNSGLWSQARSSSRGQTFVAWRHVKCLIHGTGRLFGHLGMQTVSLQGPEDFSDMGECEKDVWVAGKIFWYQQRDFQSLVMEFSDGKLKQKGFFHSVQCRRLYL
jgi:hypothetical protein